MGRKTRKRIGFIEDEEFMMIEELKATGDLCLLESQKHNSNTSSETSVNVLQSSKTLLKPKNSLIPKISSNQYKKWWLDYNSQNLAEFYESWIFHLNKRGLKLRCDIPFEEFCNFVFRNSSWM